MNLQISIFKHLDLNKNLKFQIRNSFFFICHPDRSGGIPFTGKKISRLLFVSLGMILLLFLTCCVKPIFAIDLNSPNNKFGIHLAQPHFEDLEKAKELVNSNGGDWGYVTLVLQENDRDKGKWQEIFDRMRKLHLIPIVRLATVPQGAQWRRPSPEDANGWAEFLNSLNWVTKDRYIILFNEPNHGQEWGGKVDSANYAKVATDFATKLKEKSQDFFIMLAGLDASAPSAAPSYEDEQNYLKSVIDTITIQQFNNLFSGVVSHSYPNPGFVGTALGLGRGTVRTYQWELELLRSLGVNKELPVFITETGWDRDKVGEDAVAQNFNFAFDSVWLPDQRVQAVTPFVLDYQGEPFLNFSWKKYRLNEFYQQFYTVQSLAKTKGEPVQIEEGKIDFDTPNELVGHSSFHFRIKLKNIGQAVWDKDFGYTMSLTNVVGKPFEYFFSDLKDIRPYEEADVDLYIKTNGTLGKRKVSIVLLKNDKQLLDPLEWNFEIFPLPSVSFQVSLFPHLRTNGNDFEVQIFNDKEELVFKKKNVKVMDGDGFIEEVQNIALGRKYRIVVLKKGYLPRQTFITFKKGNNSAKFKFMLPLDFNGDGKLDLSDLRKLIPF